MWRKKKKWEKDNFHWKIFFFSEMEPKGCGCHAPNAMDNLRAEPAATDSVGYIAVYHLHF